MEARDDAMMCSPQALLTQGLDCSFSPSHDNALAERKQTTTQAEHEQLPKLDSDVTGEPSSLPSTKKRRVLFDTSGCERDTMSFSEPAAKSGVIHDSIEMKMESSYRAAQSGVDMVGHQSLCRTRFSLPPTQEQTSNILHPLPSSAHTPNSGCSKSMKSRAVGGSGTSHHDQSHRLQSSLHSLMSENAAVAMEGDSSIEKTVISVIWQKGMLGACIYNSYTMKLQVMQDIPERDNFLSLKQLFAQTQPDVIITGEKLDGMFIETLKLIVSEAAGIDDGSESQVITLPNYDLGFEVSKRRFHSACEDALYKGETAKHEFIKAVVSVTSINMVRSVGGLLRYLEMNSLQMFTNCAPSFSPVLSVELYFLQSTVWIDRTTLSVLRIIHLADHPSTSLGSSYTREGFSLYGLMDRCKTSIGKKKLKEWFLKPLRDKDLLNERLDSLEFFVPGKHSEITQLLTNHLSKLRNMTRVVSRMRMTGLTAADWLALHRVLQSLIKITAICSLHQQDLPIFQQFPGHQESIQSAGQVVFDILDVQQTKADKCFTVKPNYDAEMDMLVQRHRDLPEILGESLTEHVKEVKHRVKSAVHIHYSSQLGCLLMVDITPRMEQTGDYRIDDLKLEFLAEKHAYYSSSATQDISEQYGDVKTAITDRSLALMYQLQNTILPDMESMLALLDLCAQLDCYISLSSFCMENNYVRPEFVTASQLDIRESRHPLIEAQLDRCISNDIVSGCDVESNSARLTILSGANASGKSIYLKQVALVVYLAHIGCFVPAKSAKLGLVDAIFTHFSTADSVNSDLSTFTSDLRNMALIIAGTTLKSLVILDEFGKGTCEVDGTALLMSFLMYLSSLPSGGCPHIYLSTHFHSVAKSEWAVNSPMVRLKKMETIIEEGKVTYLYELVDGTVESSNATALADLLEIPLDQQQKCLDQIAPKQCQTKLNHGKRSLLKQFVNLDIDDANAVINWLHVARDEQ